MLFFNGAIFKKILKKRKEKNMANQKTSLKQQQKQVMRQLTCQNSTGCVDCYRAEGGFDCDATPVTVEHSSGIKQFTAVWPELSLEEEMSVYPILRELGV